MGDFDRLCVYGRLAIYYVRGGLQYPELSSGDVLECLDCGSTWQRCDNLDRWDVYCPECPGKAGSR